MNLYFRLLLTLFRSLLAPAQGMAEEIRTSFRAWPQDLDINIHLNNARYLAFMDLGRMDYLGKARMLGKVMKKSWRPVVAEANLRFYKSIGPFQKFELRTQLDRYDEKYFYITQRFFLGEQLMAEGWIKGLFLSPQGKVSPQEFLELSGQEAPPELFVPRHLSA